jgi:hypothetical protein
MEDTIQQKLLSLEKEHEVRLVAFLTIYKAFVGPARFF